MSTTGHLVVDPRIVRRVIKNQRRLSGLGIHVPHDQCAAVGREQLLTLASADELGAKGQTLPDEVVLISREEGGPGALWRRGFHGRVHLALEGQRRRGELSEAAVRARIHAIGQTEFDEIRTVLVQEDLLASTRDDGEVYVEFAATYLEYRHFEPEKLHRIFPTLRDHGAIEGVLAPDVDAAALLEASRPAGAAPLEVKPVEISEGEEHQIETHTPPVSPPGAAERAALRARAGLARSHNNLARAAIAARRASLGEGDAGGEADITALVGRLLAALGKGEERRGAWTDAVTALVNSASSRPNLALGREARLLFDLQRACADFEEVKRTIDVMGWATSLGRRAIVRALPAARQVNIVRRLRSAMFRAGRVRVETRVRLALQALLVDALHRVDHQLRAELGPPIREALEAVGLRPSNAPERVALRKLVDELLDQAASQGFITISHLRDCISRSNLKLSDLTGPGELWGGDALLQADDRLATQLDGVYRRGEIYLRTLQRVSSLFFGTPAGRALTLHLLLPATVAFVTLEGLQHMVSPIAHKLFHHEGHIHLLTPWSLPALALFLYGLIHALPFRKAVGKALRALWHGIHGLFVDLPRWLLHLGPVQALLSSRPVLLLWRYLLKPALMVAPFYLLLRRRLTPVESLEACGAGYLALTLALNSSLGIAVQERLTAGASRSWRFVSNHVLPGLLALIGDLSQRLIDGADRALYMVDERLRFQKNDSRAAMLFKGAFGVFWFFVTYLVRLFINVLLEPQINPIKHFPVVTVSHKLLLPTLTPRIFGALTSLGVSEVKAASVAGTTVALIPGAVGFLVWELKGNWDLYSANRGDALRPVLVGHHGETVGALLKPGFHSGTVPKLFARMRRAIRQGQDRAGKYREQLREVEHAVAAFVERELIALLEESAAWDVGPVSVAAVELGSNRIRISLACPSVGPDHAFIDFEEQSGWVVSHAAHLGWISLLPPAPRDLLEAALAGLYRLAGVDICREQIEAQLDGSPPYDVCDEGLILWPGGDYQSEVVYPLGPEGTLAPLSRGKPLAQPPRPLDSNELLLGRQPVSWVSWLKLWARPADAPTSLRALHRVSLLP